MVTDYSTTRSGGFATVGSAAAVVVAFVSLGVAPVSPIDRRFFNDYRRVPVSTLVFDVFGSSGGGSGPGAGAGVSRGTVVNNTMQPLKLSTARNKHVLLVSSTDHITGKTGVAGSMAIKLAKDGGSLATASPAITVTELGDGLYNLALTATHTNTLGDLSFSITAPGADPVAFICPVEVERTGVVSDKTGFALTTAEENAIRDAIFNRTFSAAYGSLTFDQMMKCVSAVLLGICSGMATTVGTFRNLANTLDVVVTTIDVNGNRTAVTLTP